MRKSLFVSLLGLVLAVGSMFPFLKSDAAVKNNDLARAGRSSSPALPNFDIRLADSGEFADYDLNASHPSASQNTGALARAAAFERFRSGLSPEQAANLRGSVNHAGAIKNLFIDGAPLSAPQADTADNIARNFLRRHPDLFALSPADVANLKLTNEDNDGPVNFLEYFQSSSGRGQQEWRSAVSARRISGSGS